MKLRICCKKNMKVVWVDTRWAPHTVYLVCSSCGEFKTMAIRDTR